VVYSEAAFVVYWSSVHQLTYCNTLQHAATHCNTLWCSQWLHPLCTYLKHMYTYIVLRCVCYIRIHTYTYIRLKHMYTYITHVYVYSLEVCVFLSPYARASIYIYRYYIYIILYMCIIYRQHVHIERMCTYVFLKFLICMPICTCIYVFKYV